MSIKVQNKLLNSLILVEVLRNLIRLLVSSTSFRRIVSSRSPPNVGATLPGLKKPAFLSPCMSAWSETSSMIHHNDTRTQKCKHYINAISTRSSCVNFSSMKLGITTYPSRNSLLVWKLCSPGFRCHGCKVFCGGDESKS
jgi:hypothetical protein